MLNLDPQQQTLLTGAMPYLAELNAGYIKTRPHEYRYQGGSAVAWTHNLVIVHDATTAEITDRRNPPNPIPAPGQLPNQVQVKVVLTSAELEELLTKYRAILT
ncbi:hypothetical protein JZU56_01155, partial [bacterium]|nr:hypothetical protein [bacterium]